MLDEVELMGKQPVTYDATSVAPLIRTIRGQKIILDSDLAVLYGVETKILNKAVARNKNRFPEDFAFLLTRQEVTDLRFQIGTPQTWGAGGADIRPGFSPNTVP